MMTPEIRRAHESDVEHIVRFNAAMAEETEGRTLDQETLTAGVMNGLQHPEYGFYLVAEVEEQVVGCLMVTTEWSDWRNGIFWWIQSVYVVLQFRRQGIFSALYNAVKNLADSREDICGLRLYVEHQNIPARETYRSMGMEDTGYLVYEEEF